MEHSEKKRKLNIIDIIVILILVAALAFGAYKLLGGRGGSADADVNSSALSAPNIRFTVLCENVDPALAENVVEALAADPADVDGAKVEMTRVYNSNELLDAQIVSCEVTEGEEGKSNLSLTVEANAKLTSGTYALLWQEIRIGKEYIVKTLSIEVTGVIQSMEKLG